MAEAGPPLVQCQAAGRFTSHDTAAAQRVAAGIQRQIDRMRKGADFLSLGLWGVVGQDQRVVLVGGNGLFIAPFGTQRQPAEPVQGDAVLAGFQLEQLFGQHIVEVADHGRQLARLHTLAEQAARQPANAFCGLLQRWHVSRGTQGGADIFQALFLHREQVALRDHPDGHAIARHRHMAHAMARHQQRGVLRRVLGAKGQYRLNHDFGYLCAQRQLCQRDLAQNIEAREDTDRLPGRVGHQHRADALLVHGLQGFAQGRLGCAADGRFAQHLAQRLFQ